MQKILIFTQPGMNTDAVSPIIEALTYFLELYKLDKKIKVLNLGCWQSPDYQIDKQLVPRKSINWLMEFAYNNRVTGSEPSLNTADLLAELQILSYILGASRSIFITDFYIVHPEKGLMFGATRKFYSSVISVDFARIYRSNTMNELLYYLALHEFGHLFGLVSRFSQRNILGTHCDNNSCVMSPFKLGQKDIEQVRTGFLISPYKFCYDCEKELRQYISQSF